MRHAKALGICGIALVAAAGFGLYGMVSFGSEKPAVEDPRLTSKLVRIAVVKPATASERSFTGVVTARVRSNLGFRVNGKVIERLVDVGETVHVGQPLMRIDRKDLDLALNAKENAVAAARALAAQATADEARSAKLLADGWATREKYDQVKAVLDSVNAELAAAEAEAEIARNEVGYSLLTADADGTVVEALAEPGQVVAAGQTVIELAHAGPREAAVNLPETLRPALGSLAEVVIYGVTPGRLPARLRQLSDSAEPASRTYEARYVLDGAAAAAPLGATVTIWLPSGEASQAAEIPLGALLDDGIRTGVWVFDDGTATVSFRAVQVRQLAEETAVVTGVDPGTQVVALGAHLLHEGEPVRVSDAGLAVR